jgi:hypothetical protein
VTAAQPDPAEPARPPSAVWLVLLSRLADRVVRDHVRQPDSERCALCGEPSPCAAFYLGQRGLEAIRRAARRPGGGSNPDGHRDTV